MAVGHWRAAISNVLDLQNQLMSTRSESDAVGLDVGSPAVLFKREFDEAIRQSGLGDIASYLDKEDREVALGLAINWGASVVRPLTTASGR